MLIQKRNGKEVQFDESKIRHAIKAASNKMKEGERLTDTELDSITGSVVAKCKNDGKLTVEHVQNYVENALMDAGKFDIARLYIKYRYERELSRKKSTFDDKILSIINNESEEAKQENSNKNPTVLSVQRDYMAGELSRDITTRLMLPDDVVQAHKEGLIHVHDTDYFSQHMHNCCLINLNDILQNGTVISETKIEKPHNFSTACNIASQVVAAVASSQFGGQTITLTHLAPFVDVSRKYITKELKSALDESGVSVTEDQLEKMVNKRLQKEISDGIQTIQYQILTLMTTNGQTPFVTVFMYLNEAEDEQTKHDLALIIEEMLRQRFNGVKNEVGVWISPAFPKLIYVLEDDNIHEGDKYFYLTKLAAKVSAKRLVPDYISEKKIKELKEGDVFPSMGAAVGYETVSIMIDGVEHNNIEIEKAFRLIRNKLQHTTPHKDTSKKPLVKYKNKCGVYKLIHKPTGLYYIGASTNIARRLAEHRYSFMHKGTLGDRYLVDDYNIENLCFELLEECSMDDLYKVESKYVHFKTKDKLCVNQKDPINNGNFTSENHLAALQGKKYSTYVNGWAGTWVKEVPTYSNIFIKSCGEWVPIRNIIYNNEQCPLDIISIDYKKHGKRCTVRVTLDHPLETQKGRVQAKDLIAGDQLIDVDTGEYYTITSLRWKKGGGIRTYDFTTDNDMFDLSGIVSHNCRSFLSVDKTRNGWNNIAGALDYDPTKPKYYGRLTQR